MWCRPIVARRSAGGFTAARHAGAGPHQRSPAVRHRRARRNRDAQPIPDARLRQRRRRDTFKVHPKPVQKRRRRPAVSDGRRRALSARWCARDPRPARRSGQDSRRACRVGRGERPDRPASGGQVFVRRRTEERAGRDVDRRLRGSQRSGCRQRQTTANVPEQAPVVGDGSLGVRTPAGTAAHAQRQSRSRRAACRDGGPPAGDRRSGSAAER